MALPELLPALQWDLDNRASPRCYTTPLTLNARLPTRPPTPRGPQAERQYEFHQIRDRVFHGNLKY